MPPHLSVPGCTMLRSHPSGARDRRAAFADLDDVRRTLETNLFGAWRTAQAFLPLLRRSAHPRLVNVSSESGSLERMSGGTPAYGVSEAALNVLTREGATLTIERPSDSLCRSPVAMGAWTASGLVDVFRPRDVSSGPPSERSTFCALCAVTRPGNVARSKEILGVNIEGAARVQIVRTEERP